MRSALEKMGAPADLVVAVEHPSMEKTGELMRACDRVLATGGGAMVHSAYSSGTPALGVGVGNAVITVDDTADLDDAAEKVHTLIFLCFFKCFRSNLFTSPFFLADSHLEDARLGRFLQR
jgi:acyl-CoA reductase-like NAD-dependent aldehyde dehydrogenase